MVVIILSESKEELRRKIENIDFYIWLFKKYKTSTSDYIADCYFDRKKELIEKYKMMFCEEKEDDEFDNLWN